MKALFLFLSITFSSLVMALPPLGYPLSTVIWDNPKVSVCWENYNQINYTDRQTVRKAVERTWNTVSRVNFIGWNQCHSTSRGIRVEVRSDSTNPHVDRLGQQLDGRKNGMTLNFNYAVWGSSTSRCAKPENRTKCIEGQAIHEFGHALGFAHEHNRPDVPATCTDSPQGTNGDVIVGLWDHLSIMNYCNDLRYKNPIVKLSSTDKLMAQEFYGHNPWEIAFRLGLNSPVYMQASNGRYTSSENGSAFINANRSHVQAWEKFKIFRNSDDTFSILGNSNKYLDINRGAGGYLQFNSSNRYCTDCKFRILPLGNHTYVIKPANNGKWVSSENGGHPIRANRDRVGAWEKWRIKNVSSQVWKPIANGNQLLEKNRSYYSSNHEYRVVMQGDGNLVVYDRFGNAVWHTHTYGNHNSKCYMQGDGNLVIYNSAGKAIWHTHTYGNHGARLEISNAGQLRVKFANSSHVLWQSH